MRYHAKTLALFARPGRLDRGINREEVGLLSKVVDRGDNLTDGMTLLG